MKKSSFGLKFAQMSEWIIRIAYLNILWIVFTILGGVILGIGPATTSLFAVLRQMMIKSATEVSIFKEFWSVYKAEFKNGNIIFYIMLFIGFLLYYYTYFFFSISQPLIAFLRFLIPILFILYLFMSIYIFPFIVNYKMTIKQYLQNAFLFSLSQPLMIIVILIGCIINYLLLRTIPGLIPFFGISSFALIIMYLTLQSFLKIESKNIK